MQLPALLFAALAAFLIGSVSADTRPIAVPPSCSGTGQYNTGCFCTGGCGSGAQAWFSCYNAAGSKPLQDIGIRFEAGYSQPSQTRSWQISNQVGWPSGISVDQFEPNVIRGSDPSLPGPTPTVPSNTDQWYTSGVVPLNTANPTGPTMWACTKNGLLQRSSNGGFGPIQPRCYSIATGVYTAPYSQGCQESNLFDAPNSAGLQYRGWAFAGIKVKALDGSVPTPLDPGNTIIPSTPLGATELRPLPQNYAAGGVTMNCFVSLFNPCSTVVSTCPANTICVGSAAPSGNTVATCPVANCCPASSVIRPTDGSAWYCCPSGQVAVTSGTTTKCCPTGSGLDNNLNCCPNAQIVSGTRVCCPTANFDPSKPNTCCPFTVVGTTCCPVDPATVYTGTPAIPSNQNFLSGSPAVCCPTANVNDQPSTSNVACCPTTTGGNKFVDKDLSGSGQASTRFCCPTTQFITSGVTRICCPATGGPFTFTTNGQEKCCPTSQLSKCSGSPFCCPNGNPTTCVGVPADGADFFPCCPTTDVRTVSDTAGAPAPRCCPGTSTTLTYVYFAGQGCCLATYVVDLTAQSGSGFTGSANGAANNKFCCPGGFGATSGPSTAVAFACSAVTSTLCTWNANSACCPTNRIASVGAVAGNRGNTLCCPSAGPFASCNSFTDCPRNPSGSNVDQINPCCPASATIVLCGTDKYCCPSGGGLECKSAGASNRRCCPTANVPLQNNVTPQDYCCPGNPGTNPFIYVDATNPCCPINRIPFLPGTTTRSYTLCCPNDGQQYVVVNSQCCLQSAAVFDTANNVWLCCPNIGSNPQVVNGNCCPRSATFNTNYCCPQFNGRSIPTGALFCPTAPTTRTDCWVNNANCQRIGGPATGCCCFAGSLTRQATNGPAVPDPAICCDAGQGLGPNGQGFFFTNQDPCCPTTRLVSTFRTTPTSADSAYCCPTTVSALPAQPIGGVTCSYYTPLPDKNGNTQTCCRNCDVSRNLAGATSTDPNARCCDNAAQIPTIVDVVASGTSSSYTRFCCPASFVFQYQGTSYCCPASIAQVPISKVINNVCCPPNQDVAIPGGSTLVCCPNYDSTKGIPVWTDLGTGGSGNCCPPNQALTFSGSGLPNVPASNATGAPTSAAPHRFCCPANQLPSGVPAPDAYIPALDAVSGSVNFNTNYNNLRCCPAANVLRVQAPNGKVYDVCCPNPNMIFNKDTGQCCPQGVIAPPCPVPYPLVGCSGSCCPPGQTGAIGTSGNPPLPTGSTQSCCPTGQIRTFLGVGYCCPSNVLPTTTGAFYNNDPTKIRPCCPVVDQLTCPASNAGCNATTAPYQLCCPAGDFPIPANVAGNTPPPSLIVDPQTGKCCRGYLNSASGPRPGGNRCCVPKAGITVYFQAADDPCCTTLVDPTDGTCCPLASYRVNAQGQALCCPANTVWATNDLKCCPIALATGRQPDGTYTDCCDDPLYTNDPGQTCCPTSTLQNGYCCPPTQLDDFGRCCLNNTTPLNKFIDTSSGVPVVVLNKSVCCDSGLKDCAGFCYFLDPADDVVKAYHVQGANNTGCCPSSSLDCAGQCPSNCANGVCTGPARNNGTITDCCPDSKRGCLNGVPNAGACGAADTNCCAQLSGRNCTACTTTPGCGWCNAIGSASGLCLSGDYFGPNAGVEGIVCNQTGGFRWTAVGESKIFQSINGFGDGRNIEYANVSVLLAKNVPIVVPFRIKAPNDLPLDLYILQDRTNSFIQPVVIPSTTPPTYIQYGALDVLKGNLDGLDAAISALVPSGYHLGFGTFGDKAVEPFGFWANSGFFDFVFQNVYPISANRAATIAAIKALDPNTFAGGNDIPEASIEALLHVAQNPVINWGTVRANSLGKNVPVNKIAIVVTDAPAHTASTNWAAYAPGVRFPNTDFPNAAPGAAQDLSFYLTPATQPSKRVALNPVDSWKAHSGVYTDTDCLASDPSTARIRQPVTAFDPARQGICTDYPSASQVATAIGVTGFTSVFAVAETVSALYPLSAGYDFWSNFSVTDLPAAGATPGLTVKLDFTKDPNAPGGLVYTIREAIKNITQSITFENTTSSQFMNTISSSFTLPPDGIQTVNVPLFWDGTDYGSTGPFPIDFQAIFPLSGYVIDVARINVYISPEKRCCFCGDGVVQNETGCDEECDNDGATDSVCCKACKIDVGQICSNDNLCVPVICEKDGKCTPKNINDECVNDVLDPFAFCQFNTCIAGSCIVTCSSDACCNDSDPCTQDSCNDLSLCQYTLLPECDCSNQAFNNCFDCVRNNNTKCAYEANSGTCFQFNETIYEQGGYGGSEINPVTDEKGISRYCIVVRPPGSKTGVIVGAVVGTLAALGLIALAAALWWRLRNGPILAPGGTANTAGAAGAAQANPTYVQPSTQTNPLHDNGGGGN